MTPRSSMALLPTYDVFKLPPPIGGQNLWGTNRTLREVAGATPGTTDAARPTNSKYGLGADLLRCGEELISVNVWMSAYYELT